MNARPFALFLVLVGAALSGCLGGAPETAPTAPTTAAAPGATITAPPAEDAVDAPEPRVVPVAWEGRLGPAACVPSGVTSCSSLPLGQSDSFEALEERPTSVSLTMTWSAQSPLTSDLVLYLLLVRSCGDGCFEAESLGKATGPSPLTYEGDVKLGENETIALSVSPTQPACFGGVAVYGCARATDQPFKVEGALVVPADAP